MVQSKDTAVPCSNAACCGSEKKHAACFVSEKTMWHVVFQGSLRAGPGDPEDSGAD